MALHSISICSGIGGLDLGVSCVINTRVVCYIEREFSAVEILVAKMEEGWLDKAPIYADLASFNGKPWRGKVGLITAGLPCQPFSVAGKRRGESDERYIWPMFFRVIKEVQPAMVFIENVSGILKWFRPIGDELCRLGYKLEAGLFTAEEVGASHKRERFFCLAYSTSFRLRKRSANSSRMGTPKCRTKGEESQPWRVTEEPRDDSYELAGRNCFTNAKLRPAYQRGQVGQHHNSIREMVHPISHRGRRVRQEWPAKPKGASRDFPPRPNDHEAWRELLVRKPWMRPAISQAEIESLVCRSSDGLFRGLDRTARLRALGNAVVPAQAAYALKYLIEKANG